MGFWPFDPFDPAPFDSAQDQLTGQASPFDYAPFDSAPFDCAQGKQDLRQDRTTIGDGERRGERQ